MTARDDHELREPSQPRGRACPWCGSIDAYCTGRKASSSSRRSPASSRCGPRALDSRQGACRPGRSQLAARAGERWFDRMPDREPRVGPALTATPPDWAGTAGAHAGGGHRQDAVRGRGQGRARRGRFAPPWERRSAAWLSKGVLRWRGQRRAGRRQLAGVLSQSLPRSCRVPPSRQPGPQQPACRRHRDTPDAGDHRSDDRAAAPRRAGPRAVRGRGSGLPDMAAANPGWARLRTGEGLAEGPEAECGRKRGWYGKIKSHLTCGASQRHLGRRGEARPFRGTSWPASTYAARPLSLGAQPDVRSDDVAVPVADVLLAMILARCLHVNLSAGARRRLYRPVTGNCREGRAWWLA
jgi:hypothetical protein